VDAIVLRMLLGSQLRRLREAVGITPEQAGAKIRGSRSKISRMETGRVGIKPRDLEDLLALYGVADEQARARFLQLAKLANQPDWWAKYGDVLPDWFETYLGLESAASTIRSFEIQFVNALFQTEDYARAVTRLGHRAAPPGEIEHRVALRLKRQDLLMRPSPPRIWSVMDESVLRRPAGDPAVLRAQLGRLIEVSQLPHVTIQVLPFDKAGHAGESGSFTFLRFEERDLPDVVYTEQLTSALYLEQRPDVEHYLEVMDGLSGYALRDMRGPRDMRGSRSLTSRPGKGPQ
jgi:transcriptional regulator with XRE-family HTH domain